MKTLVIHPEDPTTYFLTKVYENYECTIVRTRIPKSALRRLIRESDRIIMLGHGTEKGLIDSSKKNFFIDSTWVAELRNKPDVKLIWCNADVFARKYKIHGIATGMIISEEEEAIDYCVTTKPNDIDYSNYLLAKVLHTCLEKTGEDFSEMAKDLYQGESSVIKFNRNNIHTI